MNNLNNHIVLVTGAGSGIGSAIAKRLARDGARIFLNDIDSEKLNKINTEILNLGCVEDKVGSMVGDVSSPTDMKLIFQACLKKFDDLSMLVNNAGILQQKLFTDISVDDWDRMINVHLKGCFLGCHFAVPLFKKRGGGIIVNVASQLGQIGASELTHYASAKAGIIGLTKSLAREVSKHKIKVNAVAPGPINTELVLGLSEDWRNAKAQQLPLGHFGEPDDVAATVAFLASDDARIYVGQTLGPNSGDVML